MSSMSVCMGYPVHVGITEPVRSGVDVGIRLGLGKQEQDNVYTNADNIQRRMLETEIQANEDEDRKERREVSGPLACGGLLSTVG